MGIDVGEKTLGLAVSDNAWRVASPLCTLRRNKKWKTDAERLVDLWKKHAVAGLVVGLPLLKDGSGGAQAHSARHVAQNMADLQNLPCLLWDERFSTQAAVSVLRDKADLSRQKRHEVVDGVAAAWILQGVLEALRQEVST
jgi:putative Holliday junction resolvase